MVFTISMLIVVSVAGTRGFAVMLLICMSTCFAMAVRLCGLRGGAGAEHGSSGDSANQHNGCGKHGLFLVNHGRVDPLNGV